MIAPLPLETHAGEDVGIYARGPMSHLIHTKHEQSYIAHAIAYAACFSDPEANHCTEVKTSGVGSSPIVGSAWTMLCVIFATRVIVWDIVMEA